MSRKDLLVRTSDDGETETSVTGNLSYCSECRKKLIWEVVSQNEEVFHRDLYDLMECSNRCKLCEYICNLFGQHDLVESLTRAAGEDSKPRNPFDSNAANRIVYHRGGYTNLLTLLRAPTDTPNVSIECGSRAFKGAPTVRIEYDTTNSFLNSNGYLDHVLIHVSLDNLVSGSRHYNRAFTVHTEYGRAFHRAIWNSTDIKDIRSRSATVREWLRECRECHPDCRKILKPNTPLAARILTVQEHEPDAFSVKLISTENINLHNEPYVVLSHVWGGMDMPCKTTVDNILQYQDVGIDFKSLPRTFRDAVRVTVAVGFQYLWIDSLAIIQDDKQDWQRESAKMAAIFRAGSITLSATCAENGHGGCGLSPEFEPVIRFSGVQGGPAFSVRKTATRGESSTDIVKQQLMYGPVNKRAWILQESMLSRRILHATYSQFVWQCASLMESEDSTVYKQKKRAPTSTGLIELRNPISREQKIPNQEVSHRDEYELDRDWWKCVADYSNRSLTISGDRYAALAGIVQLHQDISNDLPIVGLWSRHLVYHLAWKVHREARRHTTPLQEPAIRRPSWTWMSFEHGSVGFGTPQLFYDMTNEESRAHSLGIVYQAQILQTIVKWSGEPLTSDPSGSTIRIRGVFCRMSRPKPVRRWSDRSPLHLDPEVIDRSEASSEYDTLALTAYVRNAALTNQPPVVTTSYLVIRTIGSKDKNEYMRIGSMELTEGFEMLHGRSYMPKGVTRDITLV